MLYLLHMFTSVMDCACYSSHFRYEKNKVQRLSKLSRICESPQQNLCFLSFYHITSKKIVFQHICQPQLKERKVLLCETQFALKLFKLDNKTVMRHDSIHLHTTTKHSHFYSSTPALWKLFSSSMIKF